MQAASPQLSVTEVAERFRPGIQRYVHRMVRNEADAEDLVQETFVRVTGGFASFRGESALSTWVYRIATNVCLDFFRRRRARPEAACRPADATGRELADAGDPADVHVLTPEALLEDSEMGRCVREYVDSLPAPMQAALILHDLEGLTNPEVAGVLDWSLEKAKINVHRARRRLRERLERECVFYRDERDVLRCDRRPCGEGSEGG